MSEEHPVGDTRPSPSVRKRRGRGILGMVTGPLPFYPYDPSTIASISSVGAGRSRSRRRHTRDSGDVEGQQIGQGSAVQMSEKEYDPYQSEFTLFYFADSTCLNCLRFNPILAKFVQDANSIGADADMQADDDNMKAAVQCMIVPNDTTEKGAQELCRGMGVFCLPFDHANRLGIIRLLSVQRVPTVIVVRNDIGQKVTDLAMEGIESHGIDIIKAWRDGTSGLSLAARAGCVVS